MSESSSQQPVVSSLGSEEYALPIAAVHEIIRFTEPRSVASEVAWIRGVIGLRGKILPIFDLAADPGDVGGDGAGLREADDLVDRLDGEGVLLRTEAEDDELLGSDVGMDAPLRRVAVRSGRSARAALA